MNVVELTMVQIMGSIEDEKTFSTLTFMKMKLWDKLSDLRDLVVHMFAIALLHYFNFFSYNDAITIYTNEKAKRGLLILICRKHNGIFNFGFRTIFWVLITSICLTCCIT